MSAANQLPAAMTVAEFLAWDPPDFGDRWELVDGIPQAMAPAAPKHGFIQAEAARLIGNHLAEQRPQCRVATEPGLQPKVDGKFNVRVPDLAVTCANLEPGEREGNQAEHLELRHDPKRTGNSHDLHRRTSHRVIAAGSRWRVAG